MAWAWQLLSSLSVTVPTEKPKHQPLRWFLAHLPSTSPSRAEARRDLCQPQRPVCPGPGNNFRSSALLSCLEKGPRVAEQRGSQGLVVRKERGTVCPRGSGLGGRSQVRRPGASPRAGIPQASLCSRSQDTDRWWLLSQTWASCCQATLSLGVPWLSVGSGRHL